MRNQVVQPIVRRSLRRKLGKFYYRLRRHLTQLNRHTKWARQTYSLPKELSEVISHRSLILRPLKDVDMYLQENKRTNLRLAIKHIDKVSIAPGEVFSFWKLVGNPSKGKGYLDGLVLNQGKIDKGIGGGLCQLGNLIFWMAIHSPLDIIERHRHGFDVFPDVNRKVPFGAGATLSYNYIDLQIKNNTSNEFYLEFWLDDTHLNGKLSCSVPLERRYSIQERNHIFQQQSWGGYTRHNQIFQLEHDLEGEMISERLIVENHAIMMYPPFLNEKTAPKSGSTTINN